MKKQFAAFIFAFSFLTFHLPCLAQGGKIDSLRLALRSAKEDTGTVNTLNLLGRQLYLINSYDTAMAYTLQAKALAEKLGFSKGLAAAHRGIGNIYTDLGKYETALVADLKALDVDSASNNRLGVSKDLGNLGNVYMNQGNYQKALEYDSKALAICRQSGNKEGTALNLGNLGNIYQRLGNFPEAVRYDLQALTIYKELNNTNGIARNLGNLGGLYFDMRKFPIALEYQLQSLQISRKMGDKASEARMLEGIGNNYNEQKKYTKALEYISASVELNKKIEYKSGIAIGLASIGRVHRALNDLPKALSFYLRGLDVYKELHDKGGVSFSYLNLGEIYLAQKNYPRAREYFDKGLQTAREVGEKTLIKNAYSYLCRYDTLTGNFKEGIRAYKMYILYMDTINNESNTQKRVQAEMNYEFEQQKVKDKAEQTKKDTMANEERKKQIVIRNAFIGGFTLVLLFAFFIFRGYRQKQRANIIITQQKEEVEKTKEIVEQQKNLVEEHQKEIIDSITYAKRLQQAILPPDEEIKKHLPNSFKLYKPKDIVAGDFYWMHVSQESGVGSRENAVSRDKIVPELKIPDYGLLLIAAADSTGHGVPGAMVSVVCSNALNRAVNEFKLTEPGKILDKTRDLVLETFAKSGEEIKDGMDISLLAIDRANKQISWSGANNPLWVIKRQSTGDEGSAVFEEIKANKQPIGKTDNPKPFTTHSMELTAGDTFYLMTDGYADQFSGETGKKLMTKKFREVLLNMHQEPMPEQQKQLDGFIEDWKAGTEQVDDILVIGIRV